MQQMQRDGWRKMEGGYISYQEGGGQIYHVLRTEGSEILRRVSEGEEGVAEVMEQCAQGARKHAGKLLTL